MATKKRWTSEQEVIDAIEKRLDKTIPAQLWEFLRRKHYLEEFLCDEMEFDKLVEHVEEHLELIALGDARSARGTAPLAQHEVNDYRVLLVSYELAKIASTQPYVGRFRRLHLPAGSTLAPEDVRGWVQQHTQGALTHWMVLVVDMDVQAVMKSEEEWKEWKIESIDAKRVFEAIEAEEAGNGGLVIKSGEHDVLEAPIRWLEWPTAEQLSNDLEERSAVRESLEAAEYLSQSYGWRKHQAIWFLLTGETPLLPMLQYDIRVPQTSRDRLRITLDIDIETSPDTVASLYRDLRKQLLHGERRPLQRKMLALALFVDSTPDMEWAERMKQWNKYCRTHGRSDWAYKEHRNMFRDYKTRTIQRLQPEYDFEKLEDLIRSSWSYGPGDQS